METKKSNGIYLGLAFILGMLILGGSLVLMIDNLKSYDRCVTVKGLCEKEVMADKVIWPIVYKQAGNELGELYNRVKDMNNVIVKFLKDAGVSDDEITTNAPFYPRYPNQLVWREKGVSLHCYGRSNGL